MHDEKRLIFYIDAYSPDTMPMAKLADYMADFAELLGKENAVHFVGLEKGSTKLAARVEFEDVPKVMTRVRDIARDDPPQDAAKLFTRINTKLANDNAIGRVLIEDDKGATMSLLEFPGRELPKEQVYGPFTQAGALDGVLISVGGKDESVPLRLQNGETIYSNCDTTRAIARELGKHLFDPIRVHGTGKWVREVYGKWALMRFRVYRFDLLATESLRETVAALRAVRGSGWKEFSEPLTELDEMRRDVDEVH